MSRLPPVPPASKPVHGPDGIAKTSVDISHRVRHQVQRAAGHAEDAVEDTRARISAPASDPTWMLVAIAAAMGLGYLAGRRMA